MTELRHGRYFAQELMLDHNVDIRAQIQTALDAGETKEWHLVGVSDVVHGERPLHEALNALSTFRNYIHSEPRFRALPTDGDARQLESSRGSSVPGSWRMPS